MIEGVQVIPLKQYPDYRGKVMKMMSNLDKHYDMFGEIYFSVCHPGIVKGWHRHKSMHLNYVCVSGKVQLVLYDTRQRSSTYDELMEVYISPDNYCLVHVPPLVYNAFMGLGTTDSIVANLTDIPYTEKEIERYPLDHIEFDWWKKGQ